MHLHLKILYHANCFDGCVSAAVFSRFFAEREGPRLARTSYLGLQHRQGDPFPKGAFDADVNACVDFRFSASPRLAWWFDHHASAFQPAAEKDIFLADASGQKFWDPGAPSCAGFMARVLAERFGWSAPDLAELFRWTDIIDSARFSSPSQAVRLEEPALRIMTLLEATHEPGLPERLIESLRSRPLSEIAAEPWVVEALRPILERHFRSIETVKKLARLEDGVVEIDLSESGIDGANKFIAYDLFPQARYTVVVSRDTRRSKVSVGFNPWANTPRTHDIARICERYGGGGHPVVGGISLDPERILDARRFAREIATVLRDERAP
ncbi:MAG TPA: phosphoesterase [Anaeromyxobacteraceae bacterium]|nr:phosphoesterase [Anaeromyxobacteraceae bacterium]